MLTYPHFNPIALQIGPIKIFWYGIMYVLGFAAAWLLALYRAQKSKLQNNLSNVAVFTVEEISDFIFYCAVGVIVGGRVGYIVFYYLIHDFIGFISNPWVLFKTWEGGMSFHGGLIGVALSLVLFAKKHKKHFLDIADFAAPLVPIGLFLGRIGNFINGELWGRVTHVPWGLIFPFGGPLPRHPSQLYEASLEGIALAILLWIYSATPKPRGKVAAWFLLGYGCTRFFCEMFREPDSIVFFNWLTTGQTLSLPMIGIGIWMLLSIRNRKSNS